jgi:hypothetical protein
MPSKSRLFSQLIAGSGQIKADRLSDDISTIEQVATTEDLTAVGNTVGDQRVINNNLYIWNGSGWYRIALINASPTWDSGGQPAASYELDADSPQDATVITLAASDPDGLSISYNYVTSGSMDSMATISQDSSVFTITPKTVSEVGEGVELTGSITFRASDGVNILPQVSTFRLNFITVIENSRYTTLLATATDTSDNNNITDASSNNHTITVNGDAHAGTFSPYRRGGYSTYFDGNDYLTTTQTTPLGTADFTVEGWINFDNVGGNRTFITLDDSAQLYFRNSGSSIAIYGISGGTYNFSTGTPEANTWYHFAFVRQSGSITLYWDGQSKGSVGCTDNFSSGNLHIGCWSAISEFFQGHLTDIKISNTAVYTSNFSVSTERLSSDSSTKLLICHLPYIADGSNLNETITVNGDPTIKPFSPYDYLEYSTTDHGGAINFDGTGDYLTIPDHSSLNFASNDWTIECWIYPRTNVGDCGIWHQSASGSDWYSIYLDGAFNLKFVFYNLSNGVEWAGTAASNTAPQNTWTHVALVRQFGTGVYLYANGKLVASDTLDASVTMLDKTYNHVIGYERFVGSGNAFDGFISDFKMDIGTAHYTAEFTPPTTPLSSTASDLHIKGTDASIIDKSQSANLKLVGTITGSTTQVKFADTKSIYSDGTAGNHISIPADDSIFSKDYTVEFWMYPTQDTNLLMPFSKGYGLQFYHQSGNIAAAMSSSNSGTYFYNGNFGSITTNAWSHISLVRDSSASTYKFYINGTLEDTLSSSTNIDAGSSDWIIAAFLSPGHYAFEGYIQDVRVTEGLTRYTTNFTPPTKSLEG